MSSKAKAHTGKQIAEEASFQLACSKEFTGWMVSLMKAIQLDREHELGTGVEGLAELGKYLAEAHLADVERACEAVDSSLADMGGAL
jgi:hypothetical protein